MRGPGVLRGGEHSFELEARRDDVPALAFGPDERVDRNVNVVEERLVRAEHVPRDRVQPPELDARRIVRYQKDRQAFMAALLGAGAREHVDDRARDRGAGGEELLPRDAVAVGGADGARLDPGHVAAGVRLGDAERIALLAAQHRRNVALDLLARAVTHDVEAGEDREPVAPGDVESGPRELLTEDRHLDGAVPRPAELLGEGQREVSLLGELREERLRIDPVRVPLVHALRGRLLLDEDSDRLAEELLVLGLLDPHPGI